MSEPLRFLHASDLRIERPLGGMADIPPHWRAWCIEAPRTSAARAFELAREEHCEFVVLAGDVVDPQVAGLKLLTWLNEEFERLDAAGVRVYWSGGKVDAAARWPRGWKFPRNVVRFKGAKPAIERHSCASGETLAICGSGASLGRDIAESRWTGLPKHVSRVFVAHGRVAAAEMKDTGHDYWALGGRAQPARRIAGRAVWRYSGTPQARQPREASPHGVSLVEWDGVERFAVRSMACDAVRYRVEHVPVAVDTTAAALEERLRQRLVLAEKEAGRPLLVWWRLDAAPDTTLRRSEIDARLLAGLRHSHGSQAWSVSIDWAMPRRTSLAPPNSSAAAGFLKELEHCEALSFDELRPALAELGAPLDAALWRRWRLAARRRKWIDQAARLGLELLEREPVA